jgi:heme-degrading monooxygenase HmoA
MSVIVLLHFPIADIAKAKQTIASRADLLEEITEDSKKLGAQHHRLLESNGELIVLDEWETAEGFQRFFHSNPKLQQIIREAGVLGPPQVLILQPVEAAGTF